MLKPVEFPDYIAVKPSKRARKLALRLDTQKRVMNLVIPRGISQRRALRFVNQHHDWITEKLAELPMPVSLAHGVEIPVLGQLRSINISYDRTLRKTDISLENKEIIIKTNLDDPAPRLKRFLKAKAREIMEELAEAKAQQINKTISKFSLRDTKSRWGSCGPDGSIMLSWRLIFAPYEAMDYVIAHEIAHLKHHDHSRAFWDLCEELCEDYESGKYWMRNHGQELMRYA